MIRKLIDKLLGRVRPVAQPRKTVVNILAPLNQAIADLKEVAERNRNENAADEEAIKSIQKDITVRAAEAVKADEVAGKLTTLVA